jgi:hypothetical protein
MGKRSGDHQRVAGKQYFDDEVQTDGNIYHTSNVYGAPIDASVACGSGFLMGGTFVKGWQTKENGIRKTTITLDAAHATGSAGGEGLFGGDTGDAVGFDGEANSYFLDLLAATGVQNEGIIPSGELPIKVNLRAAEISAGGFAGDIILELSATGTTANDANITSQTGILDTGGASTLFETHVHTAWSNVKRYLYITDGAGNNTVAKGGKYIFEIESVSTGSNPTVGLQ